MRHLRDLIGSLESKGYTNLLAFKLHWDHQLYKVLEFQYVAGLNDLSHKLPDIGIDIVFRYNLAELYVNSPYSNRHTLL